MRIFVAGATGVLGRRAVDALVAERHQVTGVARSDEKAGQLRTAGADAARIDVFDADAVRAAVAGHDVVMNLTTNIPPASKYTLPGAWKQNDRLRTEASRNLVDAAIAAGAQRYVQESIAFAYRDGGDAWIDEDAPLDLTGSPHLVSMRAAEGEAERFTRNGGTGVVLRFGQFYAPDAMHTVTQLNAARKGVSAFLGPREAYSTSIHADDLGTAVAASLRAPAGVYNVTDDEPLTRAQMDEAVAAALGRKKLRRAPSGLMKLGGKRAQLLLRSQRVSNARFKEATGWAPGYRSVREGIVAVVATMRASPSG